MQASLTRNSSTPVILRQILDILTRSSIWSALGLHVTLNNEEMVLHNETNVLNINLQAQPNKAQIASYGLNRFPRSLGILLSGNSFIRPPPEIPTIQVREVGILLDFSGGSSSVTSAVVPEDKYTYSIHSDVPLFDSDGWESLDNSSPFSSQESNSTHSSVNSNSGSPASETQPSNWSENNSIRPFIPLLNAGLRTLLHVNLYGPTVSRIHEVYRHKYLATEAGPTLASPDMKNILRCLLWVQMQHSLRNSDEARKLRHPFTTTPPERTLKQHEIPYCSLSKLPITESADIPIDANGRPNPDWYLFDDEEDEDILLSDEAYCEQQEKRYDISTTQETAAHADASDLQTTLLKTNLVLDSDGILSSSPCLLAEVDMDPLSDPEIREDFDLDVGLAVDMKAETELTMGILQSSSPLIPASPAYQPMELFNIPNLDSSDIEMML
ncbi:hypothetical protein MauCBS54593_004226 [Microsporum audouinii]